MLALPAERHENYKLSRMVKCSVVVRKERLSSPFFRLNYDVQFFIRTAETQTLCKVKSLGSLIVQRMQKRVFV